MSCSNDIKPLGEVKCGYIRPMDLDERRQLLERQKWISNVVRLLGMSQFEAERLWVKIQSNPSEAVKEYIK